jgi:hypothetical protein
VTVLEGDVELRRHDDGRVEIIQAPPVTRIALEMLAGADPVTVKVTGNLIHLGGQVIYRVTGWDQHAHALLAELVDDRRPR